MSDREIMNAKNPPSCREELQAKYPEIAESYEQIAEEQYELFASKMLDYGKGNISVGSNLDTEEDVHIAMTGLWFRINDKIQRLKQLVLLRKDASVKTESIKDTFQDLSIYGIIAQIVSNGDWK